MNETKVNVRMNDWIRVKLGDIQDTEKLLKTTNIRENTLTTTTTRLF